jgi:hypothetical protein
VSQGQADLIEQDGAPYMRLTGQVSTANNGGFIQVRHKLDSPPADDTTGVRIVVRGNNQPYFVHLRTRGTRLPWQYYQAEFLAGDTWSEVRLPFSAFERSGRLLRNDLKPATVTSVGIVAYGRDHQARVEVKEVGFY